MHATYSQAFGGRFASYFRGYSRIAAGLMKRKLEEQLDGSKNFRLAISRCCPETRTTLCRVVLGLVWAMRTCTRHSRFVALGADKRAKDVAREG